MIINKELDTKKVFELLLNNNISVELVNCNEGVTTINSNNDETVITNLINSNIDKLQIDNAVEATLEERNRADIDYILLMQGL